MIKLPVMERFYTLQGEGFHAGAPAYFIRTGGCDVGCVWCDVKESWDPDAHPQISVEELTRSAVESGTNIVVITGGEPAMYDLRPLTDALKESGLLVHIETSGAYPLQGHFDWITVSPKKFKFPLEEVCKQANELKVVVFNESDFKWAEKHEVLVNSDCKLFLQPEWERREEVHAPMIRYVQDHPHWRISLQTHKYLAIP
jgi:organic radical activating enzyme